MADVTAPAVAAAPALTAATFTAAATDDTAVAAYELLDAGGGPAPGLTWSRRTTQTSGQWRAPVWGNGVWLLANATSAGSALVSADGLTWTGRALGTTAAWVGAAYGGGAWVVLAATGAAGYSATGAASFAAATGDMATAGLSTWSAVAYGGGIFAALPGSAGGAAATSATGQVWTRPAGAGPGWSTALCHGGGQWIAAGPGGFFTSPDAITWTAREGPASAWQSIAYGNGRFLAVSGAAPYVATSTDGAVWTTPAAAPAVPLYAAAFGGGAFLLTGVSEAYVGDGAGAWTPRTLPAAGNVTWRAGYGGGGFLAAAATSSTVAFTAEGSTLLAASGPGDFTARPLPFSAAAPGMLGYGGGQYLVPLNSSSSAATSPDGISWTPRSLPGYGGWTAAAYGGGTWAVVQTGSNQAAFSTDGGATWLQRPITGAAGLAAIGFHGGLFIALPTSVSSCFTSPPDAQTWTTRPMPATISQWYALAGAGDRVVATANAAGVAYSGDGGLTWATTASPLPYAGQWRSIAYGNGLFVAVSTNTTAGQNVASSPDGMAWTARTVGAGPFQWVAFHAGLFYALSAATTNLLYTSADAVTWTSAPWPGFAAGGSRSVVVGGGRLVHIAQGAGLGVAWLQGGLLGAPAPAAGTVYSLRVRARDAAGNVSALSPPAVWPPTGGPAPRTTGQLWPR